jgi:hypothetical protein
VVRVTYIKEHKDKAADCNISYFDVPHLASSFCNVKYGYRLFVTFSPLMIRVSFVGSVSSLAMLLDCVVVVVVGGGGGRGK